MNKYIPLFMILFPLCSSAQLTLSEIMYNPAGSDYYTEYIEIYNLGAEAIDLTGWKITDGTGIDTLVGHNNDNLILQSCSYALILDSGYWEHGENVYDDLIPSGTLLLTTDDNSIGAGGLVNSYSETVSLLNPTGHPVSSRTYLPNSPQGFSEEKILLEGPNDNDNWAFSDSGGSPGTDNTVFNFIFDLAVDSIDAHLSAPVENTEGNILLTFFLRNYGIHEVSEATLRIFRVVNHSVIEEIIMERDYYSMSPGVAWEDEITFYDNPPGCYLFRAEWLVDDQDNTNNVAVDTCFIPLTAKQLIINEIYPSPNEKFPGEWIEIFNNSDFPVPINGNRIIDAGGNEIEFDSLYSGNKEFLPDSFYVVGQYTDELYLWPDLDTSNVISSHGWASLNNDGDSLKIIDYTGFEVDRVVYPEADYGKAFQRISFDPLPSESDWVVSPAVNGGSPGLRNPGTPDPPGEPIIASVADVRVSPNPFSPNGDGFEDILVFSYRFPSLTVRLTLHIYDSNGRKLGTPLRNKLVDGSGFWEWDGKTGLNSETLYTGLYIYTLEAVSSSGRNWKEKGVFATTGH